MDASDRREIELACTRLIQLYATLNDAARWAEVAALYAPDGLMTRPTAPDQPIVGRDAILAAFEARSPRKTQHVCANVLVTVESEEAASATSVMLLFTDATSPPLVGTYRDRFVRLDDDWLFAERRGALSFPEAS